MKEFIRTLVELPNILLAKLQEDPKDENQQPYDKLDREQKIDLKKKAMATAETYIKLLNTLGDLLSKNEYRMYALQIKKLRVELMGTDADATEILDKHIEFIIIFNDLLSQFSRHEFPTNMQEADTNIIIEIKEQLIREIGRYKTSVLPYIGLDYTSVDKRY